MFLYSLSDRSNPSRIFVYTRAVLIDIVSRYLYVNVIFSLYSSYNASVTCRCNKESVLFRRAELDEYIDASAFLGIHLLISIPWQTFVSSQT